MTPDPRKWNCALNIVIESLHKLDPDLAIRAKNAGADNELRWLLNEVEVWVREKRIEE